MDAGGEDGSCPACGEGVLVNVAYQDRLMDGARLRQDPSAREIRRYSCGHERPGARLASADPDGLKAETRTCGDTVEPAEDRDERP